MNEGTNFNLIHLKNYKNDQENAYQKEQYIKDLENNAIKKAFLHLLSKDKNFNSLKSEKEKIELFKNLIPIYEDAMERGEGIVIKQLENSQFIGFKIVNDLGVRKYFIEGEEIKWKMEPSSDDPFMVLKFRESVPNDSEGYVVSFRSDPFLVLSAVNEGLKIQDDYFDLFQSSLKAAKNILSSNSKKNPIFDTKSYFYKILIKAEIIYESSNLLENLAKVKNTSLKNEFIFSILNNELYSEPPKIRLSSIDELNEVLDYSIAIEKLRNFGISNKKISDIELQYNFYHLLSELTLNPNKFENIDNLKNTFTSKERIEKLKKYIDSLYDLPLNQDQINIEMSEYQKVMEEAKKIKNKIEIKRTRLDKISNKPSIIFTKEILFERRARLLVDNILSQHYQILKNYFNELNIDERIGFEFFKDNIFQTIFNIKRLNLLIIPRSGNSKSFDFVENKKHPEQISNQEILNNLRKIIKDSGVLTPNIFTNLNYENSQILIHEFFESKNYNLLKSSPNNKEELENYKKIVNEFFNYFCIDYLPGSKLLRSYTDNIEEKRRNKISEQLPYFIEICKNKLIDEDDFIAEKIEEILKDKGLIYYTNKSVKNYKLIGPFSAMSDKILSLHNNVDTGLKVETERHEYKDKTKPPKVKYKDIQAIPIKEFINTIAQYSINTHYKYADKDVTLGQTISNIFQRFNMSKDYSIQENFGGKIKEIPKIQEKILKETFEKSIRQRAKEVIKEFFIDVDLEYANNRYIGLYDILSKSFKDIEE